MVKAKSVKLVLESPTGRTRTVRLPLAAAWAAARGVSMESQYMATLHGEYGTARFGYDGGGSVEWNERSATPGATTTFDRQTTVCI